MTHFPIELALRATLLACAAWGAAAIGIHARAAVRHGLWAAAFLGLSILPVAMLTLPEMPVAILPPAVAPASASGVAVAAFPLRGPGTAARPSATHAQAAPGLGWSGSGAVELLWLLGSLVLLAGVAADCRRAARLADQAGRGHSVAVTAAVRVPQVSGVRHPVVLLPEWFATADAERRRVILAHERAHIERRDCFWQLLARIGCALYWWNPLVWRGARALRVAGEQAADDRVIASELGGPSRNAAAEYASHLLDTARALHAGLGRAALPGALSYCSHLESRVRAILDPRRRRSRLGRGPAAALAAILVASVIAFGAVRGVSAAAQVADETLPHFEAVSVHPLGPKGGEHYNEHGDPVHFTLMSTLHRMIVRAYGVSDAQLSGEPGWFGSEYYEIDAVTGAPATEAQKLLMLRRALADRFQLQLRQDSRPQPVYFLEVAPGGPKFQPLPPDAPQPKDPPAPPGDFARSFGTIAILVDNLNSLYGGPLHVDRAVVNRTGLTGRYHMYLSTVMERPEQPGAHLQFPNLHADIESQLGLKLVPGRTPLPAYVVVHAERPTPN